MPSAPSSGLLLVLCSTHSVPPTAANPVIRFVGTGSVSLNNIEGAFSFPFPVKSGRYFLVSVPPGSTVTTFNTLTIDFQSNNNNRASVNLDPSCFTSSIDPETGDVVVDVSDSPTCANSAAASQGSGMPIGVLIGAIVGGVLLIAVIILIVVIVVRRKQQQRDDSGHSPLLSTQWKPIYDYSAPKQTYATESVEMHVPEQGNVFQTEQLSNKYDF